MLLKIWSLMLFVLILISGCALDDSREVKGNSEIDWVDFVKLNDHSYTGDWQLVLKNPAEVTDEEVGEVKFKVSDVVSNPNFKTREGDAGFLPIGTKLYRLNGYAEDEIIVARDETRIGGYRLFIEDSYRKLHSFRYADLPRDKVEKIELYTLDGEAPFRVLQGAEKQQFIQLLESGKAAPSYHSNRENGDPDQYRMVFYTEESIAFAYTIYDDKENVFFSPNSRKLVDIGIRELLQPE